MIKPNSKPFLSLIFFVAFHCSFGQDIHFSQYLFNPQNVNPAETGNFEGKWRASAYHKNQWKALGKPFVTSGIGGEINFFRTRKPISLGILILNDISGQIPLEVNKINLSVAYHPVIGKHHFHVGLQSGLVLKQLSLGTSTFPSQYDRNSGGYNPNLPGSEAFGFEPIYYPDVTAGISWNWKFKKFKPSLGYAIFHVNKPTESFIGGDFKIGIRQVIDARLQYQVTNYLALEALFYETIQSKAQELLTGILARFDLVKTKTDNIQLLGLGLVRTGFLRNGDSAIVGVGMKKNNIEAMMSYDVTISTLKLANDNRGGIEFSIRYTMPTKVKQPLTIPCERF